MAKDRANCTVRALAAVAAISLEHATRVAEDAGRARGCRFVSSKLIDEAKAQGFSFTKLHFGRRTLRRFISEHPVGRFYARKRGHAFAVVDGVPSESWVALGSILVDAWQLTSVQETPCPQQ